MTALRSVAGVAGVFALVVFTLMVIHRLRLDARDPINAPALERLLERARSAPEDEALARDARDLDLLARKVHFSGIDFLKTGALLLFGAVAIFIAAIRLEILLLGPVLLPGSGVERGSYGKTRWALSLGGGVLLVGALILIAWGPDPGPRGGGTPDHPAGEGAEEKGISLPPLPSRETVLANWPCFRGPDGNSIAPGAKPPLTWDGGKMKNIRWKTAVPRPGFSSPVVWEDRVFLTGGDRKAREVFCFEADQGTVLWRTEIRDVPGSPARLPSVTDDTGYAAATAATDGRLLFALFATGNLVALDFKGQVVWARNLGVPDNPYGHASSLITWKDRLLVQYDHSRSARFLALASATGKVLWEAERDLAVSWCTPIVLNTGCRIEAILNGNPAVISYDPRTGEKLWEMECMGGEVATSPAFGLGIVYVANENACLAAIEVGTGKVVWDGDLDLPDVSSPLMTGRHLILTSGGGVVSCFGPKDGKELWIKEYREGFYASPIFAGGRVYACDRKGVTHVFRDEPVFKALASSPLGEDCLTTPAFAGRRIFFRGAKHLFCVEDDGS